jgi:hypothetical protein
MIEIFFFDLENLENFFLGVKNIFPGLQNIFLICKDFLGLQISSKYLGTICYSGFS